MTLYDSILELALRPNTLAAALHYRRIRSWLSDAAKFDPKQQTRYGVSDIFFASIEAIQETDREWQPRTIQEACQGIEKAFRQILETPLKPWMDTNEIEPVLLSRLLSIGRTLSARDYTIQRLAG